MYTSNPERSVNYHWLWTAGLRSRLRFSSPFISCAPWKTGFSLTPLITTDFHSNCSGSISLPLPSSTSWRNFRIVTLSNRAEWPPDGWWQRRITSNYLERTGLHKQMTTLPDWQEVGWPPFPECFAPPLVTDTGVNTSVGSPPLDGNTPQPLDNALHLSLCLVVTDLYGKYACMFYISCSRSRIFQKTIVMIINVLIIFSQWNILALFFRCLACNWSEIDIIDTVHLGTT